MRKLLVAHIIPAAICAAVVNQSLKNLETLPLAFALVFVVAHVAGFYYGVRTASDGE